MSGTSFYEVSTNVTTIYELTEILLAVVAVITLGYAALVCGMVAVTGDLGYLCDLVGHRKFEEMRCVRCGS
jgi:hypothetical protein